MIKPPEEGTMTPEDKLLQNIHSLIGEIGQKQVLLRFFLLVQNTDWQVYQNLGEPGNTMMLFNPQTAAHLRIVIKTRQRMYITGRPRRWVRFFLTESEFKSCDYLVAYFMDYNGFYVVPKTDLEEVQAGELVRWRFTLTMNNQGEPHPRCAQYKDAWQSLHPDFANKQI